MAIKKVMGLNPWATDQVKKAAPHHNGRKRPPNTWAFTGNVICGFDETPLYHFRNYVLTDGSVCVEEVQKTVYQLDGRVEIYLYLVNHHKQPLPASRWKTNEEPWT